MKIDNLTPASTYYTMGNKQSKIASASAVEGYDKAAELVLSDDGRTVSNWDKHFFDCFRLGYGESALNTSFSKNINPGADLGRAINGEAFEYAAENYDRMKTEIHSTYGSDSEKEKLYMMALDSAFDKYTRGQMDRFSWLSDAIRRKDELIANGPKNNLKEGQTTVKENPITSHKDFDVKEFHANLVGMAREFTQAYIDGSSKGNGWDNVMKLLGGQTTTSINNLSFNDFQIISKGLATENPDPFGDVGAFRNSLYSTLANNPNLSTYIRNVFHGA